MKRIRKLIGKRDLIFFTAIWCFVLWPNLLMFYMIYFKVPGETIRDMLMYAGTLMAGPLGAYVYSIRGKFFQSLSQLPGGFSSFGSDVSQSVGFSQPKSEDEYL